MEKYGKKQSFLDAIINGDIPKYNELDSPIVKKRKLSVDAVEPSFLKEPIQKPILVTSHKPGFLFESPMSKADTTDEEEVKSDAETIDITDLPAPPHQNVKFLPKTVEGLRRSFEEVMKKIAIKRKGRVPEKTCDRNEAVFLLDELLRQDGINHHMYRQYNDFLAGSPPNIGSGITPTGEEEESNDEEMLLSRDDQIKKDITATADYLIQHDKKELQELVTEIEKDDDIIDTVLSLEELLGIYLEEEFLERDGDAIDGKIIELVNSLITF